jgi:hypothetical protein
MWPVELRGLLRQRWQLSARQWCRGVRNGRCCVRGLRRPERFLRWAFPMPRRRWGE